MKRREFFKAALAATVAMVASAPSRAVAPARAFRVQLKFYPFTKLDSCVRGVGIGTITSSYRLFPGVAA